jgi:hypothetical protein
MQNSGEKRLKIILILHLYQLLVLTIVFHSFWCIHVKNFVRAHVRPGQDLNTAVYHIHSMIEYSSSSVSFKLHVVLCIEFVIRRCGSLCVVCGHESEQ